MRTGLTPVLGRYLVKKRTKYRAATFQGTGQVELMRTKLKIKTTIDHPLKTHERFNGKAKQPRGHRDGGGSTTLTMSLLFVFRVSAVVPQTNKLTSSCAPCTSAW